MGRTVQTAALRVLLGYLQRRVTRDCRLVGAAQRLGGALDKQLAGGDGKASECTL